VGKEGQNSMEPIKDFELIGDIADFLLVDSKLHGERNRLLWIMGIYFGLRVERLLDIKVRDVRGKEYVYLREYKRKKERKLIVNDELMPILDDFIKDKADYEYLFASQKSSKPISRQQAWRILKKAAKTFDIDRMGTHTLRKTYGYIIWINSDKDPNAVRDALNLGDTRTALIYIGVVKDQSVKIMKKVRLLNN